MADSSRSSSPVSSQLSSHGSSEFAEDVKADDDASTPHDLDLLDPSSAHHHMTMPPSKRRRLAGSSGGGANASSHRSTPIPHNIDASDVVDENISEDGWSDIPISPAGGEFSSMPDEDPRAHVQVRVCKWDGCTVGDLGNMDKLVAHLHDDHIGSKETNYACEWVECSRKGVTHASGYALKAHMRSHTKEKPFYCALPECDRSFTRSDALAKHMRTVHETEALRPSDPVPRNYSSANFKPQRLKLVMNSKAPKEEGGDEAADEAATLSPPSGGVEESPFEYPPEAAFSPEEQGMPPNQLFRLLRRQIAWAEAAGRELEAEVKDLETKRRNEWTEKELVLTNLMEAELALAYSMNSNDESRIVELLNESLPGEPLPLVGEDPPWYRKAEQLDQPPELIHPAQMVMDDQARE